MHSRDPIEKSPTTVPVGRIRSQSRDPLGLFRLMVAQMRFEAFSTMRNSREPGQDIG